MIGKLISHYKITEKLGEGGMGEVYLAEDSKLKRQVAIKFLPSRITVNETDRARFIQEAQAAAAINHPNVYVIHEIQDQEENPFIVMEYVDGKTLNEIVRANEDAPLSMTYIIDYAIQIGSALQAAHEKGIIHRDIKSDNIMISATDQIKVMDFGLAKIKGSVKITKTISTVGTLAYVSPEQIEGKEIDARADIFSYGVVLYEMLAGKLPFKGEYESAIMYSILNEEPESVKTIRPDCSDSLSNIITKCLQKNPQERFQSIQEILNAFENDSYKATFIKNKTEKHNLPIQLTSFIGREKEIDSAKQFLTKHRLVTFTGAGGCGKTRLSLQVAREITNNYSDGVWFVELAPLTDAKRVPEAVASAMQIKEEANIPLEDTIIKNIKDKNLLLILDNCEHLIAACSEIVDILLKSAEHLFILITSREALNIPGEVAWRVPSLSLPELDQMYKINDISEFEGINLFIERAKSCLPSIEVSNQNVEAIAKICHRLDGIPLAIELAATRIKLFNPDEILKRLDDRFQLLTGGSRTALERQKTLRATLNWSYELLSDSEKTLFNCLSVFIGGCDIEAVEDVCKEETLRKESIFELLSSLIDKSLVVTETVKDGSYRYRLLETLRHYAQEKLLDSRTADQVRERHFKYYHHLAEKAYIEQFDNTTKWLDQLEIEHDNLLVALNWSKKDSLGQLQLAGVLAWFWLSHSHIATSQIYLSPALSYNDDPNPIVARALLGYGMIANYAGMVDLSKSSNKKSLAMWQNLNDPFHLALALMEMGGYYYLICNDENGVEFCLQAVKKAQEINSEHIVIRAKIYYCQGLVCLKRTEEAEPLAEDLTNYGSKYNIPFFINGGYHLHADCALIRGDLKEAEQRYSKGLVSCYKYGDLIQTCIEMQGMAMAIAGQDRKRKAILLNSALLQKLFEMDGQIPAIGFWKELIDKYLETAIESLGTEITKLEQEGRQMKFEKAIEYALDFDKD